MRSIARKGMGLAERPTRLPVGAKPPCGSGSISVARPAADHDHMLRVDADLLVGVGVRQPGQLHDRATCGAYDSRLHLLKLPLDREPVASNKGDLSGGHRVLVP